MPFSEEERDEIMRLARENLERADEMLRERKGPDDLTNVVRFTPKPPPEPEPEPYRLRDSQIGRLIRDMDARLDELQPYLGDELSEVLTTVFNDVADQLAELHDGMKSFQQNKYVETDIAELKSETALLRTDVESLRSVVEGLANQVAQIVDDVAAVERSNKIVTLRGSA